MKHFLLRLLCPFRETEVINYSLLVQRWRKDRQRGHMLKYFQPVKKRRNKKKMKWESLTPVLQVLLSSPLLANQGVNLNYSFWENQIFTGVKPDRTRGRADHVPCIQNMCVRVCDRALQIFAGLCFNKRKREICLEVQMNLICTRGKYYAFLSRHVSCVQDHMRL